MQKYNISTYDITELSNIIFNDPFLYAQRHNKHFFELLGEMFVFTPAQLSHLASDLAIEVEMGECA